MMASEARKASYFLAARMKEERLEKLFHDSGHVDRQRYSLRYQVVIFLLIIVCVVRVVI
jgi:hypothetical protein